MGMYIYTARKANRVKIRTEEGVEEAVRFCYSRKPFYCWEGPNYLDGRSEQVVAATITRWGTEDLVGRLAVVTGPKGKPSPGDRVYRITRHDPVWFDTGSFPGDLVGEIAYDRRGLEGTDKAGRCVVISGTDGRGFVEEVGELV